MMEAETETTLQVDAEIENEPIVVRSYQEGVEKFGEVVAKILEERFDPQTGISPMEYHVPPHSMEHVAGGTVKFLETVKRIDPTLLENEIKNLGLNLTVDQYILLVKCIAQSHDLVQNFDVGPRLFPKDGRVWRNRKRGIYVDDKPIKGVSLDNEGKSVKECIALLARFKDERGNPIFPMGTDLDRLVTLVIAATFPHVTKRELETGGEKFVLINQPYLKDNSPIAALAVANADLMSPFFYESRPQDYKDSGNAEFREMNIWIGELVVAGIENASLEDRQEIIATILRWKKDQIGVARWLKFRADHTVTDNESVKESSNPRALVTALKALHPESVFDAAILFSTADLGSAKRRFENKEATADLTKDALRDMGYVI